MISRLCVVLLLAALSSTAQAQLRGHGGPVRALAISPDGTQAISGSFDTSAIRWSLTRNVAEQVMRFHDNAVNAVAWLKDGRIVTAGADAHIAIWTPGKPDPDTVLDGHSGPIVGLAVSPDGQWLASASWDHTVRLWPLAGGAPRVLEGNAQNVNGVAFTPDGTQLGERRLRRDACASGGWPTAASASTICRRRSIRWRSRPTARSSRPAPTARSISSSPQGELRGDVQASPTPIIAARDLARRQTGRRRRHPRFGGGDRAQGAQARAHADRPRPAGVVGGVLSRQPHAADRRHRPHHPPLGRGHRRADRRRGGRRARRSARRLCRRPRRAGVSRLRRLPHAVARRRQQSRADACTAFSAGASRRCPATIFRRRSSSSTSCGRRRRWRNCSRSAR